MMKHNKVQKLNCVLFLTLIGSLTVANLAAPKKTFSENENRTLASFPAFSLSSEFSDQFEQWFSDHFVARDFWIEGKAAIKKGTGFLENNGVYWVRNERLTSVFQTVDEEQLSRNIESLNAFTETNQIQAHLILVPTASYSEESLLPAGAYQVNQPEVISRIYARISRMNCVNLSDTLKNRPDAYFRTDHHWNEKGAYLGYEAVARNVLGKEPNPFTYTEAASEFSGTMLSRSGSFWFPKDQIIQMRPDFDLQVRVRIGDGPEKNSLFFTEHLSKKDKYPYYVDGNHPYVHIQTNVSNGRKALLIKDSFAHILLPYLASEYEELEVVDLRYYHSPVSDLLKDHQDVYFIYSLDQFCSDTNLIYLR